MRDDDSPASQREVMRLVRLRKLCVQFGHNYKWASVCVFKSDAERPMVSKLLIVEMCLWSDRFLLSAVVAQRHYSSCKRKKI